MTQDSAFDVSELRQIAAWMEAARIGFIEVGRAGTVVRLKLGKSAHVDSCAAVSKPKADAAVKPKEAGTRVKASFAGVLLTAHPMRSAPFAAIGAYVREGDVLGLLRVGELCLPVLAPSDGVVAGWLVEAGSIVGYGTALLVLA
jgi:acetyl-CoA carboxylase biotin carboxyl carrier protein